MNSISSSNPRRVTMQDVANRVGVSKMTVSLALRGDPKISAPKREIVRKTAKEMGYAPDPMLRALNLHKQKMREGLKGDVVAVIDCYRDSSDPQIVRIYDGIVSMAEAVGYRVDRFSLSKTPPAQLQRILRVRGIRLLILLPEPVRSSMGIPLSMDWEDFVTVQLGRSHEDRMLPTVVLDQFGAMRMTLQKITALGYTRPAYINTAYHEDQCQFRYVAGFISAKNGSNRRVLLSGQEDYSYAEVSSFLNKTQPDAVIATEPQVMRILQACGWHVPGKTGFACLGMCGDAATAPSGVMVDCHTMGATAIEWIDKLMQSHFCGLLTTPQCMEIGGKWHDGNTLPTIAHIHNQQSA